METNNEQETINFGAKTAKTLEPGTILGLVGELGSGKTFFVKGLAQGLGVPEKVCVSSPTFVLIHEYPGGRLPLYHFDFYRLEKKEEALNLNLEEYWEGGGVSVIEWADKFAKLFPEKTRWIYFKFLGENVREIKC